MTNEFRLVARGRVDFDRPVRFRFDGVEYQGYRGDTLASALLANGVHHVATSVEHGRPRGIMAAGADEPNALVQIEKPVPEPVAPATMVPLSDGLEAAGLSGSGRLATVEEPAADETVHADCDVLVVGAGPAGLAAALAAARSGARVIVADSDTEFGGSLLGADELFDGAPATEWVQRAVAELATYPEVRQLPRTSVFGYNDDHLAAVQHRGDGESSRFWRIRAREVVLATGSHERSLVFAGNDRPGTMLAGSARTYLHRYGVAAGSRAVVFTTNDSAYAAAVDLHDAGVTIAAVIDTRDVVSTYWASRCLQRGITIHAGSAVVSTSGSDRISRVHMAHWKCDGKRVTDVHHVLTCDLLLVSGGWSPAVHLHSQARGTLRYAAEVGASVPDQHARSVRSAGAAAGFFATADCLSTGAEAGRSAARAAGFDAEIRSLPHVKKPPVLAGDNVWLVPSPSDSEGTNQYVDLARDVTVADIRRAVALGVDSVDHVQRYMLGWDIAEAGTAQPLQS